MTSATSHPDTTTTPAADSLPLSPDEAVECAGVVERLVAEVGAAVVGKAEVVRLVVVALLCEGHVLLEDVPGVGKTTLARALAAATEGAWRRIQFTPDLLPADVTGVPVFNQQTRDFQFHPGPVFANVVIADEINRASPKTQSALLEVMQERAVTVDGQRHGVPRPFVVVATQNPVEMDGTYRLPEAQLDRFLFKLSLGYPEAAAELALMRGQHHRAPETLSPAATATELDHLRAAAQRVHIHEAIYDYVLRLAQATRTHPDIRIGASTRATLALIAALRAHALTHGRHYTTPDDVKTLTPPTWTHRLIHTPNTTHTNHPHTITDILERVPVPQPVEQGDR